MRSLLVSRLVITVYIRLSQRFTMILVHHHRSVSQGILGNK
jgi:hypothetical protein